MFPDFDNYTVVMWVNVLHLTKYTRQYLGKQEHGVSDLSSIQTERVCEFMQKETYTKNKHGKTFSGQSE